MSLLHAVGTAVTSSRWLPILYRIYIALMVVLLLAQNVYNRSPLVLIADACLIVALALFFVSALLRRRRLHLARRHGG